ncbi:MAG: 50S ribosomal protein L21 [Betaproteobacteria bacterium TMED156]|nr:MAG: 50S ribosomal protein L21 [Betaproteobacteria bacterium TMED156]|tara:strand:+ start:227 stop:553 length:327 start_codon:yes stop_codon:yes gene_type:complete
MYAVIKTGGKQHKVSLGDQIEIEKLDLLVGDEVVFDKVLAYQGDDPKTSQIQLGAPFIKGAQVVAEVIKQNKHPKVKIFKFRRRKHSAKSMGHRQSYTAVEIKALNLK